MIPADLVGSGGLCRCSGCLGTGSSGSDGAPAGCSGIDLEVGGCLSDDHDSMLVLPSPSSMVDGADSGG